MTRPWVLIVAGSAALFSIVVLTRKSPDGPSAGMGHGSERMRRAGRDSPFHRGNTDVGWTAKSDAGSGSESTSGGTAKSWETNSTEARSGTGAPTVLSGGSRARRFIGAGGGGAGFPTGDTISIERPAGTSHLIGAGGALGSGSGSTGRDKQVTQDTTGAPNDPSTTDTTDEGPVLSISFDDTTVPEKGDGPVVAEDIAFEGEGATFSTDSQYAIPNGGNLTGDAGTISFCLRPQWSGGETATDASLVNVRTPNLFDNRLQITKNGEYLRFLMADNTGHEAGAGMNISAWQAGQSHLVTATWGQALSSLYVDGQLAGSQTYQGEVQIPAGTPMYIGSDYPGGIPGAQSSLSNFQVYNRPLGQEEIADLAAGCQ